MDNDRSQQPKKNKIHIFKLIHFIRQHNVGILSTQDIRFGKKMFFCIYFHLDDELRADNKIMKMKYLFLLWKFFIINNQIFWNKFGFVLYVVSFPVILYGQWVNYFKKKNRKLYYCPLLRGNNNLLLCTHIIFNILVESLCRLD